MTSALCEAIRQAALGEYRDRLFILPLVHEKWQLTPAARAQVHEALRQSAPMPNFGHPSPENPHYALGPDGLKDRKHPDTIWALAQQFGVSKDEVKEAVQDITPERVGLR